MRASEENHIKFVLARATRTQYSYTYYSPGISFLTARVGDDKLLTFEENLDGQRVRAAAATDAKDCMKSQNQQLYSRPNINRVTCNCRHVCC